MSHHRTSVRLVAHLGGEARCATLRVAHQPGRLRRQGARAAGRGRGFAPARGAECALWARGRRIPSAEGGLLFISKKDALKERPDLLDLC